MYILGPRRCGFGPRAAGAKIAFSEKCSTHHVFAPCRRSTGAQGAGAITTPRPVEHSGALVTALHYTSVQDTGEQSPPELCYGKVTGSYGTLRSAESPFT